MMVEDVSNKTLHQLAKEIIFDKIEMHSTTFETPLPERFHSLVAPGHESSGREVFLKWNNYPENGAASLWSTTPDLTKWLIEIRNSYHGNSNKILSQRMVHEMLKPVLRTFGLGPMIHEEGDRMRFSHSGSNHGYKADFLSYTNYGFGLSILTNGDFGSFVANALVRSVANVYNWPEWRKDWVRELEHVRIDETIFKKFVGKFKYDMFIIDITLSEDGKELSVFNQIIGPKLRLYSSSTVDYFTLLYGPTIKFIETNGEYNQIFIMGQFMATRV